MNSGHEKDIPPSLLAYFNRIGAHVLNFKRAMVKEDRNKYYVEKVVLKVLPDGTIETEEEHKSWLPLKHEQEAIRVEFVGREFPIYKESTEINALELRQRLLRERPDSQVYLFYNQETGNVKMIQQRYDDDGGERQFVPYTYWSDMEWRRMEPEGGLPFFKPKIATCQSIMIHEGAKAAQAAQRIVEKEEKDHVWYEDLKDYEHWGIIGGATATHRTDYSELHRRGAKDVVYVCDNDYLGKIALEKISSHYRRSMKGIYFDSRWPEHWDMADPFPNHPDLWKTSEETGITYYSGPKLMYLARPATWATQVIETGNRGRPLITITKDFGEEWIHSVEPEIYINKHLPHEQYSKEGFNNLVRPFSDAKDTAEKLQRHNSSKSIKLTYDPTRESGIIHGRDVRGNLMLNTYVPSLVEAIPYQNVEEIKPWLDFLKILIPNERDRHNLKKWIATLISRPDIRMTFGILLISERMGVGKDTLGERILAPLVGVTNCSFPNESNIVDSSFNDWVGNKRLAVVHEIYAGHSSKAYNRLKSYITDTHIDINKKYMNSYKVENWTHMFVMSNSTNALKVSAGDRRWFVPFVTERVQPFTYWNFFFDWLEKRGGLGRIRHWCDLQMLPGGVGYFQRGEIAPDSGAKDNVVTEGYSPGMRKLYNAAINIKEDNAAGRLGKYTGKNYPTLIAITDKQAQECIKKNMYNGQEVKYLEKPSTIRKVFEKAGWEIGWEQMNNTRKWGSVNCRGHRFMIIGPEAKSLVNSQVGAVAMLAPELFDLLSYLKEEEGF